jgi:hypothetical protein
MQVIRKDRIKVYESVKPHFTSANEKGQAPSWLLENQPENTYVSRYDLPVEQPTRLLKLTRDPKQITVWWRLSAPDADAFPADTYLYSRLSTTGEESHEEDEKEADKHVDQYGFVWQSASSAATSIKTATGAPN